MATKKKSKRKRRPAGPSVQGQSGATGSFRMVVAANPGSEMTVAPELDLVKAALLYGDKVTFVSPVTTMFLRVDGLQRLSPRQMIELVRRTAPVLLPAGRSTQQRMAAATKLRPFKPRRHPLHQR